MGAGFLDVVRARDISADGVSVRVPHDFAGSDVNETVTLVVILPGENGFVVRGLIRHLAREADGHYFGVEFESLTAEQRVRIERYVGKRLAEGGGT